MSEAITNTANINYLSFDIRTGTQEKMDSVDANIQVLSFVINREVNRVPTARLVLRDGEAAEGDFATSSSDLLIPGKEMEIHLGRDGENQLAFKGIITKQSIKVHPNGNTSLIIEIKDKCIRMTAGRHSRYFEDLKDSEAIEEVIGQYDGLSADIAPTALQHKELVQHNASDWDFILSRADVNGLLVIVEDGTIAASPPDTKQEVVFPLIYGRDLLDFEAEMDARTQWKSVRASAWDYANQALVEVETDATDFQDHGNLSGETLADTIALTQFDLRHSGHVIEQELEQWAKSCLQKSRLSKIRGRAKIREGNLKVKPGTLVDLQRLGDRFNGKAYVTAVRHEVWENLWTTDIQFGFSPSWFAQSPEIMDFPAAGLTPGIHGLQIGKVLQLEEDPDGEDRILVKLPIIEDGNTGTWARVASLDAGKKRGAFFRPEIDDEVIMGFVNDDPRDAVVLGMLHSSAKEAPLQAKDDNHEKGFVTRSDMRLLFDDDKKIITINTPAGNSIVISEEDKSITITDQTQNTVTLDQSGIALQSPKDISMTATGKIAIEATQDLSIKGLNVSLEALAKLSAEGSATAKLSSSGVAEIQGSLVKIN